jgi:UDP-glucose 4-epimerase
MIMQLTNGGCGWLCCAVWGSSRLFPATEQSIYRTLSISSNVALPIAGEIGVAIMTILISGGAGFLGSHLTERLLEDRFDVRVVDDLRSSVLTREAWQDELGPVWDRLEFYQESIQLHQRRGSGNERLTGIFHLAAPVGPAGILPFAGNIIKEIVDGTYAVIDLALRSKCRLVYVSTSEVYNGGEDGLCSETTPCIVPLDKPSARLEYAAGKIAGEIAVMNTPDLDWIVIRPFNISGARQSSKGGFVLPRFVQQALAGQPLTVFGDGSQRRAFTHVADIVDGLVLAMERGKSGQAYNLGNPANRKTIKQLAATVILSTPLANLREPYCFTDGKAVYGPAYAEAADKFPNADKAMTELGWTPTRSIDETVRDVIEYERNKLHEH